MSRPPASPSPAPGGTAILFSVQFRHGYYNLDRERCPDFAVVPTSDSAALMSRLGLRFRDTGDGFVVFCATSRLAAVTAACGSSAWTRLTFLLVLRNPGFVGITAMPLDISPTGKLFYAGNLQTTGEGQTLLLSGAADSGPDAFHPATGPTVTVTPGADATITLSDLSGAAVASAEAQAGQAVALSLAGCPYDLYFISSSPAAAYDGPSSVVFAPPSPPAWGMIDLLLTQPQSGQGDPAAFPITAAANRTVTLVLPFAARKTVWQYYVVSQENRGAFHPSLSITGSGATFTQSDQPVLLPTGETAILFSSTTALPLHQQCRYRFKLSGQRRGPAGGRDEISIDRLPGAPSTPVWPAASGDPRSGASEIFIYV